MRNDHAFEIKSLNSDLPEPIALNCWKHHLGYVKSLLCNQHETQYASDSLKKSIHYIGDSLLDIYTGSLDPISISLQVLNHNELKEVTSLSKYKIWIDSEGECYKYISLSDGSSWTLRLGFDENRYIHIHPSRYSINTLRVRASTLKTVFAYLVCYGLIDKNVTVEKVNISRLNLTKLPPLKTNSALVALNRVFQFFFD